MHTEAQHERSGQRLRTDAPLDHAGKSESFAPTDLLATAVGTCFLTVMGITAKEQGWDLDEITVEIDKKMTTRGPRKIESLVLVIDMPADLKADQLKVLKKATKDCPVLRNLNDSIQIKVKWNQAQKKKTHRLILSPLMSLEKLPKSRSLMQVSKDLIALMW